jgi:hypothetical protein
MKRKLELTARQVTAIIKGAEKAGCVAEVHINGVVVRFVPLSSISATSETDDIALDPELAIWEAKDSENLPRIQNKKGKGGYTIPDDVNGPLQKYYNKLGFDPLTMNESDMMRLHDAAQARWKASIPGTPLGKRERAALAQLSAHGAGIPVRWSKIKDCGPGTEERLKARGYLETRNQEKFPDRIGAYVLTDEGLEAWKKIEQLP